MLNFKWPFFTILIFIISLSSCGVGTESIKIKGSDTEVNLAVSLAESFHKYDEGVFVSISGGGSGLGIASLLNGTADIANSSRSIKPEELGLFSNRKVDIDSFIFAQDAIAFVVSSDMPIDSISTDDIAKVLSGQLTNWKTIAGFDMPINIYGRQSNSGTYDYVKDKLQIEFSQHAKQMNGNAQILEAIKVDASGIGYVGAGYLQGGATEKLKVLTVYSGTSKAYSPLDADAIREGVYYFQRPLYQYFKATDYPKIKRFIDFEQSVEGQKIISLSGYYPVKIK
jgi:phosphate transport system substrate-binding protein